MYAMSDSSAQDAGVASGLINTSMQVGRAVGLVIAGIAITLLLLRDPAQPE